MRTLYFVIAILLLAFLTACPKDIQGDEEFSGAAKSPGATTSAPPAGEPVAAAPSATTPPADGTTPAAPGTEGPVAPGAEGPVAPGADTSKESKMVTTTSGLNGNRRTGRFRR
jgi:hypothetical protein